MLVRQNVWGWLAWANFFLGGAGASLYILGRLVANSPGVVRGFDILALILLLCGLMAVFVEAGKRGRAIYAFRGFWTRMGHRSWMSREALGATVFAVAVVLDLLTDSAFFDVVAIAAAAFYLVSQSLIPSAARLIAAWNNNAMPLLMLVTSLMAGAGLAIATAPIAPQIAPAVGLITFSLVKQSSSSGTLLFRIGLNDAMLLRTSALAAILVALFYAYFPGSTIHFRRSLSHERNYLFLAAFTVLGGVIPLLVADGVLAGMLLVLGSAGLKYVVLLRMSYKLDPIGYLAELLSPPGRGHQESHEPLNGEVKEPP